jgi:hypothetical protein
MRRRSKFLGALNRRNIVPDVDENCEKVSQNSLSWDEVIVDDINSG